ncbi:MAG: DUF2167 domain-containing protein, partial [Desulfobacteraceae bacterium]
EEATIQKVKWQKGPCDSQLGTMAQVKVPNGYVFADADDTRLLMESMQNPVSGIEMGFIAPTDSDWFLVFEFQETGYIKDDEKDKLDADAMLKSIKAGNEEGNKERAKKGWEPFNIIGWHQPPRYNPTTHNLEWAIIGESRNERVINWNTRLLGRSGVMKVTLVADPKILDATMPYYETLLNGFDYNSGHRYAEFRQGDKIAKYGLSALVVGGATAVAAKAGFLKYLWKILVIAFIAVAGFFKKIFKRNKE